MVDGVIRLLFIGNSLTAANDLPATVAALANAAGARIDCTAIARPNFSLDDHWEDGEARRTIARGRWTFVVLQQGPSALPESRLRLEDAVVRFDRLIRGAGARTALYMVWPAADRSGDFAGVSRSYRSAAAKSGALLLAAGDAWRAAWQRDPSLPLYGPDRFHPSPLGSELAALVIVQGLTGRAPPGGALTAASPMQRAVLLAAAAAVNNVSSRGTGRSESLIAYPPARRPDAFT
jgi:hypothetical protein